MANDSNHRQKTEAQVERWTAEAKKLCESGNELAALALYRKAADELPGAPWLQHRTAELARKLKQPEVAIFYYRRAATAFQLADFAKRAVAPLRTAWTLALDGLPGTSKVAVEVAGDLIQLHRRLGFAADASVVFERTNAALRGVGFSEIPRHKLDATRREQPSSPDSPAGGGGSGKYDSTPPSSDVNPRGSGAPPASPSPRGRALARLFGR